MKDAQKNHFEDCASFFCNMFPTGLQKMRFVNVSQML